MSYCNQHLAGGETGARMAPCGGQSVRMREDAVPVSCDAGCGCERCLAFFREATEEDVRGILQYSLDEGDVLAASCGCGGQAMPAKSDGVKEGGDSIDFAGCNAGCGCERCQEFYKDITEDRVMGILPWLSFHMNQDFIDLHLMDAKGPPVSTTTCSQGMPLSLDDDVLEMLDEQMSWMADFEEMLKHGKEKQDMREDGTKRVSKPRPDANDPDSGTPQTSGDGDDQEFGGPWTAIFKGCVCLDYQKWHKMLPRPTLPVGGQPCRPLRYYRQSPEVFTVWWNSAPKGGRAVEQVLSMENGENILLDSILNSGLLDNDNFDMNEFDEMLKGSEWDDWEIDNYTPLFSKSPRRKIMNMALWLIASMDNGIIENFDRFNNVKEETWGEIVSKKMKYKLYGPRTLNPIYRKLCHGFKSQSINGILNSNLITAACWGASCSDASVMGTTDQKYIMYGNLEFDFSYNGKRKKVTSWNNHGVPKSSRTVHFCTIQIDRMAVMYDWFMTLAASHMLAAEQENSEIQAENHKEAQNLCIRMAFSSLIWASELILHETGHNLDLWHCDKFFDGNNKASCIQDVVLFVWKAYTMARLGLSHTDNFMNDSNPRATLRWNNMLSGPNEAADAGKEGLFVWKHIQCRSYKEPESESVRWGIDYPLMMGGNLKSCVFTTRPEECNPTPFTNCFQDDFPIEFLDCEDEIMNGKVNQF